VKREARHTWFAKSLKIAHALQAATPGKNEPGVARFALTPGYFPFTPSG